MIDKYLILNAAVAAPLKLNI